MAWGVPVSGRGVSSVGVGGVDQATPLASQDLTYWQPCVCAAACFLAASNTTPQAAVSPFINASVDLLFQ